MMDPNTPISESQAGDGGGIFARLFQSSAEIVGSLGDRVSSLLNHQQSGSSLPGTAEETSSAASTRERELQLIRLQLRILTTDGKFDEIAKMAAQSSDDEIVALAIAEFK